MGKRKKHKRTSEPRQLQHPRAWSYGLLLLVILFFGFIRLRFLSFPLERDEGEYAYAGQLILHGIAPYQFCYTMKLPGTAASYALLMAIFGQTPTGVHLGLLLVNSATMILVYLLGKRLFGRLPGVVASATFACLSISPSVLGFAAHATQFVVFFAVGGILTLLAAIESEKLAHFFWSGVLLGLAFLMKQPGVFFLIFVVFYLLRSQWRRPLDWRRLTFRLGTLLCGAMLPLVLTCVIMLRAGVFEKFWFWTFSYAREYGTAVPLSDGLQLLWSSILSVVGAAFLIWLIAVASIVAMSWDPKTRKDLAFVLGFLIFSFAATCPGLYFRGHYFVLLLPAVSLLCAGGVMAGTNLLQGAASYSPKWAILPVVLFLLALGFSIGQEKDVFFEMNPLSACRKFYSINPFAEALEISDFIRTHSSLGERIAVIGSEPEIYFYSGRLSATGYVYTYPLMEPQPFASMMQKEMIAEIEAAHPRFLIMVDNPLSWLRRPNSDPTILVWFHKYSQNGYQLVGIADMMKEGTEYHWGDAATYRPRSPFRIFVYDRESAEHPPAPSGAAH
jgi:Dolichyl-phosphate-mannose-protein mannosyltransferase